jgi:hypothetical protein
MNALTVAWKLRAEMLAILSAATPRTADRGSEPRRRVAKPASGIRRQSDIQELLSRDLALGVDDSGDQSVHGEAPELEETGVIPASRPPEMLHERRHA